MARCDLVYFDYGSCKGLETTDITEDDGDCMGCRLKKLIDLNRRIEEGRARLSVLGRENGYDYLEELRARMRDEGDWDNVIG